MQGNTNRNMHFKTKKYGLIITIVYVDDLIFDCDNDELSHVFANNMAKEFESQ